MGNLYLTYREGFPKDLDSTFIENTDGTIISYGELEEESAKYANGLSELGLQPGDRVSVQLNKSPEVVFIYLACWMLAQHIIKQSNLQLYWLSFLNAYKKLMYELQIQFVTLATIQNNHPNVRSRGLNY